MKKITNGHLWSCAKHMKDLHICSACEQYLVHSTRPLNRKLPLWALTCPVKSKVELSISPSKKHINIKDGYACLLPKGCICSEFNPNEETLHNSYITFRNGASANLNKLIISPYNWALIKDENHILQNLILKSAEVGFKFGEAGYWKAQGYLCRIAHLLLNTRHLDANCWVIPSSEEEIISDEGSFSKQVDTFLHANISRMITLNDVADSLNISVSKLTHSYQKETGLAPMAVYSEMKINRIKDLLSMGYSLKFIANQMSFPYASGLSGFFKRNTGLSPSNFKKQNFSKDNFE